MLPGYSMLLAVFIFFATLTRAAVVTAQLLRRMIHECAIQIGPLLIGSDKSGILLQQMEFIVHDKLHFKMHSAVADSLVAANAVAGSAVVGRGACRKRRDQLIQTVRKR